MNLMLMPRPRFLRTARIRATHYLIGLGGLLLLHAAIASEAVPADRYTRLAPAERYSEHGQIEVVEVFSYGCVHCAQAAPAIDQFLNRLPPDVAFKLVPAIFNAGWSVYAQGFYAARQLHAVEATHLRLFKAIWVDQQPLQTLPQLADFYAQQGLDRRQFIALAEAPATFAQMRHDASWVERWQVDSTPTFIINGRYKVSATGHHSYADMLATVAVLIQQARTTPAAE